MPAPARQARHTLAVAVAAVLWSGDTQYLSPANILGVLTRAVALGITAVGRRS
jgi:ribose/xylose/arabinose/galactoside ABC-type transport system permease subunit